MSDSYPKIAFVHIPRTGGMTFGRVLESLYDGCNIKKFYGDASRSVVNGKIDEFTRLNCEQKNAFAVLKGHFIYGFDRELDGFQYVTLLRRPFERLVSYYFYALKNATNYLHPYLVQRKVKLEEFLTSDLSIELDNYQVRAISGASFSSVRARVTQEHLELAKQNLAERFASFGLIESFDESMLLFSRLFGWRLPSYEPQNLLSYPKGASISTDCVEAVATKNRFDLALYQYAEELFSARARLVRRSLRYGKEDVPWTKR
jgi:hypothetical protein